MCATTSLRSRSRDCLIARCLKCSNKEHSLVKCGVRVACLAGQRDRRDANKSEEIDFRGTLVSHRRSGAPMQFSFHTHTHTQKKAQPGKTNKTFPGERACETEGRLYTCQLTSKHGIRYNRTTNTKKKASKLKQVSICMNTGRSCSDCFLRAALLSYCCYACQALCPCMVQ